jgi:hypothetical protein
MISFPILHPAKRMFVSIIGKVMGGTGEEFDDFVRWF